jgi:hypothetical protein
MTRFKLASYILVIVLLLSGCSLIPMPPWSTTEAPVETTGPLLTETLPAYPIEGSPTLSATYETLPPTIENPTPIAQPEFIMQAGSPFYLPNFNHPEAGCEWMGFAGQVFDLDGTEIQGLTIRSGEFSAITGDAIAYGPGGFEIQIGDEPVYSSGVFSIQVFDSTGQALSNQIFIDTYEDCERNLVLINFIKAEPGDFSTVTPTLEAYP